MVKIILLLFIGIYEFKFEGGKYTKNLKKKKCKKKMGQTLYTYIYI